MAKIAEANIDYSMKTSADYSWNYQCIHSPRANEKAKIR